MKLILKLFIFFIPLQLVHAAASSELANLLNQVHTMRANFIQTTYDNHNKPIQKSYGKMALMRPGKFRWEVSKPIPQTIIANQNRLWIYDPDLEQVTIRALNHAAGDAPALLLSHTDMTLEKNFNVRENQPTTPTWRWFTLSSKDRESSFANIQMGFAQNQIKEMRLQDHLGHTTRIQFQNIQMNPSLNPSIFIFRASKRIDVINEAH